MCFNDNDSWWNMDTYKNFRDVLIPQFKDKVQILLIE